MKKDKFLAPGNEQHYKDGIALGMHDIVSPFRNYESTQRFEDERTESTSTEAGLRGRKVGRIRAIGGIALLALTLGFGYQNADSIKSITHSMIGGLEKNHEGTISVLTKDKLDVTTFYQSGDKTLSETNQTFSPTNMAARKKYLNMN